MEEASSKNLEDLQTEFTEGFSRGFRQIGSDEVLHKLHQKI
jgi:hypothetical protein